MENSEASEMKACGSSWLTSCEVCRRAMGTKSEQPAAVFTDHGSPSLRHSPLDGNWFERPFLSNQIAGVPQVVALKPGVCTTNCSVCRSNG